MIIKTKTEIDDEFDYIYCPDNIKINSEEFYKWIQYDKTHPFWSDDGCGNKVLCYGGNAICYWINKYILNENINEKSYLIEECTKKKIKSDLVIEI